jgi:murein L,D-transpeptidase YafK
VERAALQGFSPGGNIMIHGIKNRLAWLGRFHRFIDWTDGGGAVTNAEIDQLWDLVPVGTVIELRP